MENLKKLIPIALLALFSSCNNSDDSNYQEIATYPNVTATFGSKIDLNNLYN